MHTFHNIQIEGYGQACVVFKDTERGVEVVVSRYSDLHEANGCNIETGDESYGLAPPFRSDIDPRLASAIVWRILAADSLAAARFQVGRAARVLVPQFSPRSIHGSPQTIMDVRQRVQPLGAIIRPCLLDSLDDLDRLYEYQRIGVEWLTSRSAAILADDMGLGKTAQAISALRKLFSEHPINSALIICPKQLMANWENELTKWAPELSWSRLTPPSRWRAEAWKGLFNRVHVMVTNYEQVGSIQGMDSKFGFSVLVLDEAHRVRNATAQVTSDLRGIVRARTWALTGTPFERAPSDVWTILSVVEPRRFNLALMPPSEESLRARARPYVLRRMKRDFLPGLPPEVDEHEAIELLPKQRASYDRALAQFRSAPDNELLAGLTKLRSICDVDQESGQSAKLERIIDILRTVASNSEKAVVFSHLLDPLDLLSKLLDRDGIGYVQLRGEQSIQERERVTAQFAQDATISMLLASTKVGGEGLNLVEANHVVFVNRWWNPSANNQAKDRVSRMGQTRTVIVHSFTCRDTVEELLDDILEEKGRLSEAIIESLADPATHGSIFREASSRLRNTTTA